MSSKTPRLSLAMIERAAARIRPHILRTPSIPAEHVRDRPVGNPIHLKLESLQVTGSFKTRGVMNRLMTTPREALDKGIVTASGGNHGMAVARAGLVAGVGAKVFLPPQASVAKLRGLKEWGADVEVVGERWDDADQRARAYADETGAVYFHPFKDIEVIAGQGTVALEMLEAVPDADVYLVAIGGGGLIAGLSTVIKARKPRARVIGVEPVGSPTLHASLAAGKVVTLDSTTTRVATMSCGRTDEAVYDVIAQNIDQVVLVQDDDLVDAARWILSEFAIRADLSAAAGIAALRKGRVDLAPHETIHTLICGADDAALG